MNYPQSSGLPLGWRPRHGLLYNQEPPCPSLHQGPPYHHPHLSLRPPIRRRIGYLRSPIVNYPHSGLRSPTVNDSPSVDLPLSCPLRPPIPRQIGCLRSPTVNDSPSVDPPLSCPLRPPIPRQIGCLRSPTVSDSPSADPPLSCPLRPPIPRQIGYLRSPTANDSPSVDVPLIQSAPPRICPYVPPI